jgi:hypothetical protein
LNRDQPEIDGLSARFENSRTRKRTTGIHGMESRIERTIISDCLYDAAENHLFPI